uniref:Ig-like domain-containing protein n=1 Tax=Chrysemys picta bellii TaxID=8478 RepID=A0A8C3FW79_CHRPI
HPPMQTILATLPCHDCAGVCLTACLLLTTDNYYPKPSISLRPSGEVALGGTVTVRCQGRYQNVRFLLYKDGNWNVLQDVEPAGDLAEFPIRNMNRRDAGSYSCYYRSKMYQFLWSHPSDPVELVVAGEFPGSVSPLPAHTQPDPQGTAAAGLLLLLLLLLAFVCYRRTRGSECPAQRGKG